MAWSKNSSEVEWKVFDISTLSAKQQKQIDAIASHLRTAAELTREFKTEFLPELEKNFPSDRGKQWQASVREDSKGNVQLKVGQVDERTAKPADMSFGKLKAVR